MYKRYARDFSRNHVEMVAAIIKSSTNTGTMVNKTLEVNWETLFNIKKMLLDWWEEQECSNYKRRCKLDAALSDEEHQPPEETEHTGEIQTRRVIVKL